MHANANIMTLCRSCHRNIHEGGWELQRSAAMVRVVDTRTGQEIMRRAQSRGFDPSAFFQALNVVDASLAEALTAIAYLDDDQLVEAFKLSHSLGKRCWMLEAAILLEAHRRSVYGDRSMESIARRFEISLRQAQKYALVWRIFFTPSGDGATPEDECVNVDAFSLEEPSWYVVAASESPDPQRWLAYAQDKKAEDPRYSIRDFRADIQQAVGAAAVGIETAPATLIGMDEPVAWDCPWVKPFCRRSGRPVPANECPCERDGDVSPGSCD